MKYSSALTTAALLGGAAAGRDYPEKDMSKRTFAIMQFNGDPIFQGMVDPIVNPGTASTHEHTVFGGSNFSPDATGASMTQSKCTSAKIKSDKSAYWVPTVMFHDEKANTFERVPVFYTNVYYFFEPSDDEKIVPFPEGLSMLAGDVNLRQPMAGAAENLNPDKDINNVMWTCPRSNLDSPGWPEGSDGTKCGMQDPNNKGQGVGFPTAHCDGYASPLRADIHFPSCYNPEKDPSDYKNNMAWPKIVNGKQNCPEGWLHVPHIFMEVYWDTQKFNDRWTPGGEEQPFVLSNGDATGYSLHADFLNGWDHDVLDRIINTCDAGHKGMHNCPMMEELGQVNNDSCKCEGSVLSMASKNSGAMTSLPGNCPLSGFKYGPAPAMDNHSDTPVPQNAGAKFIEEVEDESEEEEEEEEVPEEQEEEQSSPDVPAPDVEAPAPTPEITKSEPLCVTRTKTVMETVTAYADEVTEQKKRHLHRHHARHYRS